MWLMGVGAWRQGCPGCCLQCFDLKTLMHEVWGSHDCWNELLHLPAVGGELLQVLLPKEGISLLLGWPCVSRGNHHSVQNQSWCSETESQAGPCFVAQDVLKAPVCLLQTSKSTTTPGLRPSFQSKYSLP